MDESTVARFWAHVDKHGPVHPVLGTRCWIWVGAVDKDGYGVFGLSSVVKSVRAHRFAWGIGHAEFDGQVLHYCDNPPCVRLVHLFEGTPLSNMQDKVAKGRHISGAKGRPDSVPHGEEHAHAKLTDEQVLWIRANYVPRKVPLHVLEKELGVGPTTVYYAIHYGWKHLV